jgi:O-antigen ligase
LIGLIYFEDISTASRLFYIIDGLEKILQRPLFGYGIGSFRYNYSLYSHNNYIEVAYSLGIIGLLIYYNIYFNIFRSISSIRNNFDRNLFYFLIIVIPILDFANVSYYSQLTFLIITILLVSIERTILLENKKKNIR